MTAPFFSIIVPTCHRNDLLERCLRTLVGGAQSFPADRFEIIVTDDGRRSSARDLVSRTFPEVRWVQGPKRGPAANRNNGARQARGEWLAFIDDDCLASPEWLSAAASAIEARPGLEVVEGKTITPDPVDSPFAQGVENLTGGNFWSCNLFVRPEAFKRIGGFDEDFLEAGGEDMEFAWRLLDRRLCWEFANQALVKHPVRWLDWKGYVRYLNRFRWIVAYRLKTRNAPSIRVSPTEYLPAALNYAIQFPIRNAWLLFRSLPTHPTKTKVFQFLQFLLLGHLFAIYLVVWEMLFRSRLKRRGNGPNGSEV